jgi:hypothetical protein
VLVPIAVATIDATADETATPAPNNTPGNDVNPPALQETEVSAERLYESDDFDFEVVGLYRSTNGRSCCQHEFCGAHLQIGDVVRLVGTVVTVSDEIEEAIKIVRIMDGADGCTVGFIPRVQASLPKMQRAINRFAIVQDIYNTSANTYKIGKSKRNNGMACCILLSSIEQNE